METMEITEGEGKQIETIELTDKVWEKDEIERGLRQLPALIATQTNKMIEAEARVKSTKHILTLQEAAAKTKMRQDYEDDDKKEPSATALNAYAYEMSADTRETFLAYEKDYELAKAHLQWYRDMFDSIRKAANLRIEEMRQLEGTVSRRQYTH